MRRRPAEIRTYFHSGLDFPSHQQNPLCPLYFPPQTIDLSARLIPLVCCLTAPPAQTHRGFDGVDSSSSPAAMKPQQSANIGTVETPLPEGLICF